ncbi:MAG: PTS sugar transporter subunit IIA [Lentisphaeria bacterium]|nr:PTS sugar transporter subunit IIA [Lentisphaerota bacterium]MBR7145463.1 PTS sugar transporter subunit IIA [Lentisphaeria bacterium]
MEKISFGKFLTKDSIVVLHAEDKKTAFDQLVAKVSDLAHLDRDVVARLVWKRENMMPTGVGHGLGMPHIRVERMDNPVIIIGVCANEIADYETQDGEPVRVIVFIAADDAKQEDYLGLLSSVSGKMRNSELIAEILENITKPAQILKLLQD